MGNHPSKATGELQGAGSNRNSSTTRTNHQDTKVLPTRARNAPRENVSNDKTRRESLGVMSKHSAQSESTHRQPSNERAKPMPAPSGSSHDTETFRRKSDQSSLEPSGPPRSNQFVAHANFAPPPRLPLPIGEELHTPGSPVLGAHNTEEAVANELVNGLILRPASAISNTTLDDEEIIDETKHVTGEDSQQTVPTTVIWKQSGEKVYVTGTFTGWSRKFRLNQESSTGYRSAILQLPPGTHHVKFIVDGEMRLSDELPTAVDFTNILVNYIEVSADNLPSQKSDAPSTDMNHVSTVSGSRQTQGHEQTALDKPKLPTISWGTKLPTYLQDIDLAETTNKYQRAAHAVADFPNPPGLPMFLGKSILNGSTPMKDDNSVLNMPNHTVLNHLATSSIKHDVLATSLTTRYIRKYVTTIVYKPTEIC